MKFIESDLTEVIHKIRYKDCVCFLEYEVSRTIQLNAYVAIRIIQTNFFSNNYINKFILLLRKGV